MKQLFTLLIFLSILHTSCISERLNGISEIELLMSEKEFKELVGEKNLTLADYPFGTNAASNLEGEDIKAFHIDKFVCKNNLIIEDITVSFIFDRLYCIHIKTYNPKLEKWLKEGYKIEEREYDGENYIEKLRWETNAEEIICRIVSKISNVNLYNTKRLRSV
mgnify:CR=1 FL=1